GINGFSALGLVEMTRKRTRESIEHVLCQDCPVCKGRGTLKMPEHNGILFGHPGDRIGTLTFPASNGPMLQVVDNPNNPVY
ncbi:cellulose biosynthesis cyclic di-GMP-binding regulatory protein BcsB, partial [Pantoea agglomerans]|uniref:cellulose biosynthesis cyclic di-GMP-binding regulatory protein BcsB n=1 Tax=Enterobacter agglomerans TaxID=549 RepID=UPI001F5DA992